MFKKLILFNKYYQDHLYRNSIAIILNSVSASAFGLLFWIVAAHLMPSEDIGYATTVISIMTLIVTISLLGMDVGLIRYLPRSDNKDELFSTVVYIVTIMAILITIIFIISIDAISPALSFLKTGLNPLLLISFSALFSVFILQNNSLIALRKADLSLLQSIILGLRIPILMLVASLGFYGIFLSLGITYIFTFILGAYLLYRIGLSLKFTFNILRIKEIFVFSLGNYTANIFSIAPSTIIPLIILNTIGAKYSAYFYIAYSISNLLLMIPGAISMSLLVEGSHNLPIKENLIKSIKFSIALLVPAIIITFFFGDKLLLLFNQEYSQESFNLLRLLAISSFFYTFTSIYITLKRINKNVKDINIINILLSITLIIACYIASLNYGLVGIGYAWLISNILICLGIIYIWVKFDLKEVI